MMLSCLTPNDIQARLKVLDHALASHESARQAVRRIAETFDKDLLLEPRPYHYHTAALALAESLGIAMCHEAPVRSFSWDGIAVRTCTETAVLLHEIAHWQIAPEERRCVPDFGLGAGPETGWKYKADAARCVDCATKEREEDLASLLGILWEVKIGGPAIIAFCEQNWLELYDRPGTLKHLTSTFLELRVRGFIDHTGQPIGKGLCHV